MQTGERWGGKADPRDLTGARQRKLLAEKAEREKRAEIRAQVANIDIAEVRRAEFNRGFDAAWDKAYEAGWNAALASLDADDDPDEPGDEQAAR